MRRKSLYVALYSYNYFKNFMSERDPNKWNNEKIRKKVFWTKKWKKQKLKVIFLNWVKIENVITLKCSFVFVLFFVPKTLKQLLFNSKTDPVTLLAMKKHLRDPVCPQLAFEYVVTGVTWEIWPLSVLRGSNPGLPSSSLTKHIFEGCERNGSMGTTDYSP